MTRKSEVLWKVVTRAGWSFYPRPERRGRVKYDVGRTYRATREPWDHDYQLCSGDVLHASRKLFHAIRHGRYASCGPASNARFTVLRVMGVVRVSDYDKVGCRRLTVLSAHTVTEAREIARREGTE